MCTRWGISPRCGWLCAEPQKGRKEKIHTEVSWKPQRHSNRIITETTKLFFLFELHHNTKYNQTSTHTSNMYPLALCCFCIHASIWMSTSLTCSTVCWMYFQTSHYSSSDQYLLLICTKEPTVFQCQWVRNCYMNNALCLLSGNWKWLKMSGVV